MAPQQLYQYTQDFTLESGRRLPGFHLAYHILGDIHKQKDNIVWIFHALTANSNPAEWWPGLVGEGKLFDPAHYCLICVNMPTSCYGSLSPLDTDPLTHKPFLHDFPLFTTRDIIHSFNELRKHLGIERIKIGIGGSMGGQQLLEWAIEQPELFESIIPIATNAVHSPWGIAFNASQRMAIEADPTWKSNTPDAGLNGMKVARSIALISYRNYKTYDKTQQGFVAGTAALPVDAQVYRAQTYQYYQGEKLAARFNAYSYYFLSRVMDAHNVGRGRGSVEKALSAIRARTLTIGIASDVLFPPEEQEFIAAHIPHSQATIIQSDYGHDGFLVEYKKLEKIISDFLQQSKTEPALLKAIY